MNDHVLIDRLETASQDQISLIRSLKEEVSKLTKRMGRFSNSLSLVRIVMIDRISPDLHYLF